MSGESTSPGGYEAVFKRLDHNYYDALIRLEMAQTDLQTRIYADGYGPLTIERIEPDRRESSQFKQVVERYGWPTMKDDVVIEGPHDYDSGAEFVESLPVPTPFGPGNLASHELFRLMSHPPKQQYEVGDDPKGLLPVKHRAHVLAPDFFDALQEILHTIELRYDTSDERNYVYEEIMRPSNRLIQESMLDAYRIMGRLLKVKDPAVVLDLLRKASGNDSGRPARVVVSADEELRYSN